MRGFVLVCRQVIGRTDDNGPIYEDSGWYAGYTLQGPIIVTKQQEAYTFPARVNAERVLAGDERLKAFSIREV